MSIDKDLLDRLREGRSSGDLFGREGILSERAKALAEHALSPELDDHLSEERAQEPPEGQNRPANRRNHGPAVHVYMHERGSRQQTVAADAGKVVLDIPRDRNRSFDPVLIAKYQRRFPEFDTKIISMYARGMTTRETQGHSEENHGFEASPSLISAITDTVMQEVTAWQPPRSSPAVRWCSWMRSGSTSAATARSRTRRSSWPWRSCRTARGTFWAWGSGPMRGQ